jgi:hypothetical protein
MALKMPASSGEPGAASPPRQPPADVAAARGEERRRGEGEAMAGVAFRDPPDLEAEIAALRLAVARALVNAPSLPLALPAFDLTLLTVAAERSSIDLVLGKSSPIAKLRLAPAVASAPEPPLAQGAAAASRRST